MTSSEDYPKVIYPEWFGERQVLEAPARGYLSHLVVELEDGSRYPVFFYDIGLLVQMIAGSAKSREPCVAEPGMIILPEVTIENIEMAVRHLWKEGYFTHLKPLNRHLVSDAK